MNQNVFKILIILITCLFFFGFVSANNEMESTTQTKEISSGVNPNITEITPTSGKIGEDVPFTLTGIGFSNDSIVYLENELNIFTKNIIVKDVNASSSTSLSGTFNIPSGTATGTWIVKVKDNGLTSLAKVPFTISP
jgi:hypothetical protein